MTAHPRTFRLYHLLAVLPVVAILGAPWFANRIEPFVLGMPFLLAWIAGWVVMCSVVMATVSALDERRARAAQRESERFDHGQYTDTPIPVTRSR